MHTTPLHDWHLHHKARMISFSNHQLPLHYEAGIVQEHLYTRSNASLFDVSHMGIVRVEDHEGYVLILETLMPSDFKEMISGEMKYTVLLNGEGGILDDLVVIRDETGYLLVLNGDKKKENYEYINRFVPASLESGYALIALQGPTARDALAQVSSEAAHLPFMRACKYTIQGIPVIITCSGYTGEDGFEIMCAADAGVKIADLLLDAGAKPAGLGARDSLRLEAGFCLYGHDLDVEKSIVQASLEWVVGRRRRREGGFKGWNRYMAERDRGVAFRRVGLSGMDRAGIAREGSQIYGPDGRLVGKITSGCPSPTLGHPIAMGYLRQEYTREGAEMFVQIREQKHLFSVVPMPFVSHNYRRAA